MNYINEFLLRVNIVFSFKVERRTYRTLVCDFGVSVFTTTAVTKNSAHAGTMMYQHKESLSGKRPQPYMDVYAIGCIMLELYTSRRVWTDIGNPGQLFARIFGNEYPSTAHLDGNPAIKEIVEGCFKEPSERASMQVIVQRLNKLVDWQKY